MRPKHVCACGRACVRAWVRACVWLSGAVLCAIDFQSKHCGFDPRRVQLHTPVFSVSISEWLPTAKCVCLSMRTLWVKNVYRKWNCRWPKTATGSCVVQDQAPQQWWSVRSALQPDRLYDYHRLRQRVSKGPKVCVCVYVCVCMHVCMRMCYLEGIAYSRHGKIWIQYLTTQTIIPTEMYRKA